MRTQVAIIGAGPAGLFLAHFLHQAGVDAIVLERRSRSYVEGRVRAGVLERTTTEAMTKLGLDHRLRAEGLVHDGVKIAVDGDLMRIDLAGMVNGATITVYGQSEVMKDLNDAAVSRGLNVVYEAEDVALHDLDTDKPFVTWREGGQDRRADCDIVAGCDGYHGIARAAIPESVAQIFERVYPFGWLGVLAEVAPCNEEVVYASHPRGFALASMRSRTRSRYYVQCPVDENLDEWPDERFWDEVSLRLGPECAAHLTRGPSFEKSIAPLRSFVAEPMRWGRLFLAGDAAHIVPPTGAKGMNLAVSDVIYLSEALIAYFKDKDAAALDRYSERALARVWKAERFSWWFTSLTHRFPDSDAFNGRVQTAELKYMQTSQAAQAAFAENYVGLPLR